MGLSPVAGSGSLNRTWDAHREAILTHAVVINAIRNASKCAHVLKRTILLVLAGWFGGSRMSGVCHP